MKKGFFMKAAKKLSVFFDSIKMRIHFSKGKLRNYFLTMKTKVIYVITY